MRGLADSRDHPMPAPTVSSGSGRPLLAAVFQSFQASGVAWSLLRGTTSAIPTSGDIDLLVHRGDVRQVGDILTSLGFARVPGWGDVSHPHYLAYEPVGNGWLWLDVASELAFVQGYRLKTGLAAECLARRQVIGTTSFLAPNDYYWALLLHCVLDKRIFSASHKQTLTELAPGAVGDGPIVRFIAQSAPPTWSPTTIVATVRRGEWEKVEALGPALARNWPRRLRRGKRGRLSCVTRWAALLSHRIRCQGPSIALLGTDGAGKSTLAAEIKRRFPLPSRVIYMGIYSRWLDRATQLRFPPLVIASRVGILWGRYLLARYHQARGRLVIFDRYPFDALLPARPPVQRLNRISGWFDAHACPAPDMSFLLDAPGEVMFLRKGARKHTAQQLGEARASYLAIAGRIPGLRIIDSSRAVDQVLSDVTEQLWALYRDRLQCLRRQSEIGVAGP